MNSVVVEESVRFDARRIAEGWCRERGSDWGLGRQLGSGGTAPVFEVTSPDGLRALKIYDQKFSSGELGEIEEARIQQQLDLRGHDCQSLVQVYEGGRIQDRLYLLMSRAPGIELEKCLRDVPRDKVRSIVHQVAEACIFLQSGETGYDPAIAPDRPICILTVKGCKGLEFRTVHWLFSDDLSHRHENEDYYTVITRAKTSLDIYHTARLPEVLARAHSEDGIASW